MTHNEIEKKLVTRLTVEYGEIPKSSDILGIYRYGSVLFGSDNEDSDLDYCIVISDEVKHIDYLQIETEEVDLHIMSESKYKEFLEVHNDMALSMYFQRNPVMKYNVEFVLDKQKLRKSISTKANHSFVKFKKKLIVEEDFNPRIALKSLYHSLRLLDFGRNIADDDLDAYNQDFYGENIEFLEEVFKEKDNNWEEIHKIFKPIFNEYLTEFKKVAPKGK